VSKEADETLFWLELLIDSELITSKKVESLMAECEELLKIFPGRSRLPSRIVK